MRRCNLPNLFYDLNRSTSCFNSSFCFFTHRIYFEDQFILQLAITQYFYFIGLADQTINVKIFQSEFTDIIFFSELGYLAHIEYFVFNPMRVFKSTFWNTTLDRHLATFVSYLSFVTGAALSTLCTFCRSTSMPGTISTTNSFFFMSCPFCRS